MANDSPILTIAIVNFNYGRFLDAAIRSVVEQECFADCELVIADGGSTDDSVEIIRRYESKIGWWTSEPDKGQSDAFNKAFSHARGKYLTWLNADDIMPKGALAKIVKELKAHPKCEWFTGNMFRFTEDGKVIEAPWGPHFLPSWLQGKGMPIAVYGPATIFSKRIFDAAGGMKLHQNFMMDADLWMRFVMMGVKQRRINAFCWAFRMHEESKTAEFGGHKLSKEQRAKFEAERKASHEATGYRPSAMNHRLVQLWRILDGSMIRGWWIKRDFTHYAV